MELDDFDKILASAKLPEKDIPLCLRSDLQEQWEKLNAQLDEPVAGETPTLAGNSPNVTLATQVRELEAEMEGSMVTLTLRAMERNKWWELVAAHPPRDGVYGDTVQGFNGATIWDDLIADSLVEPKLDKPRVTALLDKLTSGQMDRVAGEAWALNRRDTRSVPFSLTASRIIHSSDGTSKPPPVSGSPTAGGRGGSRRKSPATATTTKDD